MATFEPPTQEVVPQFLPDSPPLAKRLMAHFGLLPRGRTVLKAADGTYSTVDEPSQDDLDAASVVYQGGHVYTVDATEAAALEAAGYTVT